MGLYNRTPKNYGRHEKSNKFEDSKVYNLFQRRQESSCTETSITCPTLKPFLRALQERVAKGFQKLLGWKSWVYLNEESAQDLVQIGNLVKESEGLKLELDCQFLVLKTDASDTCYGGVFKNKAIPGFWNKETFISITKSCWQHC